MRASILTVLGLLALIACKPKAPPQPSKSQSRPSQMHPVEALNAMDPRTPVPLQPMMAWHQKQNMMEHLVAIQRITNGLAREDWDEVAKAAAAIGSSQQMKQMCEHMGAGAKGFTAQALEFHRRADAIGEAAKAHDVSGALRATSNTLSACTGCHAVYRQEIVDAETWQARTRSAVNQESP